jgi:histidine ammonia-lyase
MNLSSSIIVGNGRRIALEDLIKIAVAKCKCVLDIKEKDVVTETVEKDLNSSSVLFNEIPIVIRAGITSRIVSLLQGKSNVRLEVIKYLAETLNANKLPAELIDGFKHDFKLTKIISNCNLNLSNDEVYSLSNYPFISIGVGCLLAGGLQNLQSVLDSVAALSCEAYGSKFSSFDQAHFDVCRQHRGQMLSASNIRLLLEGSKRVNTIDLSKEAEEEYKNFHNIPQVTGPCLEAIKIAIK